MKAFSQLNAFLFAPENCYIARYGQILILRNTVPIIYPKSAMPYNVKVLY